MEALVVASGSSCSVGARPSRPSSSTCGKLHTQHRCFSRLDDAWRAEFGDDVELPPWADLLRSRIAIFDLDFDAILSAMHVLSVSAKGDCYQGVPPDPGIAAAALGASDSCTLPGIAPAQALHTFTLDSGASRCFLRDSTTLTPLPAPVPVRLIDPSGGPVVARSSTVLPFPAVPSGSLSGSHLPSFSSKLVSTAALQDAMVTTTTPGGQRVSICTCTRTGRHLATFTRRPGSSLYTLAIEPPHVAASSQVSASGQVATSCSCHLLLHQNLLWHHRLGHPSLPRLRVMHLRLLVSGLPRSLPPLPPSRALLCLPCVKGRQRAAPHSSFPPTNAPLHTLQMDVWGPARVSGQSRERYFLLVVDDYTRFTTDFPLPCKGEVIDVLIPWIYTVRLQLRDRFGQDLPVLRLHSVRGGEFSSNLLWDFCRGEGILQSFMLLDSAQKTGIAERRIGFVMVVARTSMIHAADPHFLWPFAVRYAAHQLNLWPRVSLSETSPTLRWTGEVGDMSVFRFYHPTSRHVLPSQNVMFDESVSFYRLFPYRSAPPPPPPLFLAPGPLPVDPLPPQGPVPSGVSQVDPLSCTAPVEVAVGSGAVRGAASRGIASEGAEPGGAESEGAGSGGAESEGVVPGGAESEGAESGGAEPRGAASSGCLAGASPRLSPQQLRELLVWRELLWSGATGAGDAGAGSVGVTTGAGGTGGNAATGPGGARTRGAGAAENGGVGGDGAGEPTESRAAGAGGSCAGVAGAGGAGVVDTGTGGAGAAGAGVVDPGAGGARGNVRPRPFFVPLLQQVLPRFGFQFSSPQPSPLSTSHSLLAPPSDESVEPSGPYPELVGCLMYLMTCTRPDLAYPLSLLARYVAPGRHQKVHWDAAKRVLRYLCSTSGMGLVLGGRGPVVLTGHADALWVDDSATQWSYGSYEYLVMPFGLCNASATFRVKMNHILWPLLEECIVVYLDDILIYSKNMKEHVEHLQMVIEILWKNKFYVKLSKSDFALKKVQFLGHMFHSFILVYVDDLVFATVERAALAKVLWRFGFQFSTIHPTPLAIDHWLTGPFPDEPFESSGPYAELVGCPIAEAEIYAGAMVAQELRWLTFLLTDLGERPCLAPTLYADNKAMILLCREP
ncbi:unnamed protein product [Closterium sp. NIES-53]